MQKVPFIGCSPHTILQLHVINANALAASALATVLMSLSSVAHTTMLFFSVKVLVPLLKWSCPVSFLEEGIFAAQIGERSELSSLGFTSHLYFVQVGKEIVEDRCR